jgi:hypothetical protein
MLASAPPGIMRKLRLLMRDNVHSVIVIFIRRW